MSKKLSRAEKKITKYSQELTPILHRILEVSAKNINLQQVPNWPRDSLPKSPIVQKLGLIAIPIIYPWWTRYLEIEYEQFGPYSPAIADAFTEILDAEKCSIINDQLVVQPPSFDEVVTFPEITEILIQKLISYSNNPILSQFECLELFSIIAVEQEAFFRKNGVLRRVLSLDSEQQQKIMKCVFKRMIDIPHLSDFINERGIQYSKNFINECIDVFYDAISMSFVSINNNELYYNNRM